MSPASRRKIRRQRRTTAQWAGTLAVLLSNTGYDSALKDVKKGVALMASKLPGAPVTGPVNLWVHAYDSYRNPKMEWVLRAAYSAIQKQDWRVFEWAIRVFKGCRAT